MWPKFLDGNFCISFSKLTSYINKTLKIWVSLFSYHMLMWQNCQKPKESFIKSAFIKSVDPSSSISTILASSSSRLPVSSISASSSFSFIEHLLVANGHARMIQESDVHVCYTTSMYVTQSWCIPDEIGLCYFRICIITHNNNTFNKTSMYSRSKFCPQKTLI